MSNSTCSAVKCGKPVIAKQLCVGHYRRMRDGEELGVLRPRRKSGIFRDELGRKECNVCLDWKAEDEFPARKTSPDGLLGTCNDCIRERARRNHALRVYNLSPERYDEILREQGGRCATCGTDTPGAKKSWAVDHDHACCPGRGSCGQCIRGLLCQRCNMALGLVLDSADTLRQMATYLDGRAV